MAERLAARLKAEPALNVLGLLGPEGDPHLAWLDLLWGPRFDHAAALDLAARQPQEPAAAALWQAAGQRFDALPAPLRQRLRRLIVRHARRALPRIGHAPHPAD